jgi:xanthine/CO dehydrogenase XdhC/CoxF family maturation factor
LAVSFEANNGKSLNVEWKRNRLLVMSEISAILTALADAPHESAALATLVRVEGSSYRRPGARLLLLSSGMRIGSISGGCLEDDILLRAQQVLKSGQPDVVVYDTTNENDIVWGVGLGCQGVVRVFLEKIPVSRPRWMSVLAKNLAARRVTSLSVIHGGTDPAALQGTHLAEEVSSSPAAAIAFKEVIQPPPALFLFGAGDDARPLVRLATEVGWSVTVVDSRAAYATAARFPEADAIVVTPAEQLAGAVALDADSLAVLMTHRYAEDLKLLRGLLARKINYLGVLGPRKRTDRLLAELKTEGFVPAPEMLERLCAPVGLDLGSTTPETVALSILAEIQCRLTGRTPIHLRDRAAPIHG